MKPFRKIYINDEENLNRVQDSVAASFAALEIDPFLNRISLSVSLGAVPVTVPHSLGRVPQGWITYDIDSDATVWRNSWTKTAITLVSSAPVNIKLFLF